MTEGGDRQYGDQFREQSVPPPPPPPWGDQPAQAAQPDQAGAYGQPDQAGAYGQPDQAPYGRPGYPTGEQPPYQQPYAQQLQQGQQPYGAAPPYQQQPYSATPWGTPPPGWGGTPNVTYASWGARAGALLLDVLFTILVYLPGLVVIIVGTATGDTENDVNGPVVLIGGVLLFAAFLWTLWNQGWRQGSQGWSWGKQVVGIKLVRAADAQPPGGWTGIGRLVLRNILGNVTFGIYTLLTYLWPLWDDRNQSLDDKMLSTLVVRAR